MTLSLKSALNLKSGDTLYDLCGDKLVIKDYSIKYVDGKISNIMFVCYDNHGYTKEYEHYQTYASLDEMDDAEKSFCIWIKKNHDLLYSTDLEILQQCYVNGFYAGFNSKLNYRAEEQLQK